MQNSRLIRLIRSLGTVERRNARYFLQSPLFNTRKDVLPLFDWLCRVEAPDKPAAWAALHPGRPFDDTHLRLQMSYLNRLLEMFLLVQGVNLKIPEAQLHLAGIYRKRGLNGHFDRTIQAFGKSIEQQPLRNEQYYTRLRHYHLEQYESAVRKNPAASEPLKEFAYSTDVLYLTTRLRMICLEISQHNVYQSGETDSLHRDVIALAESRDWSALPAVATYLAAIRMMQGSDLNTDYHAFMRNVTAGSTHFSQEEMGEFFTFAVNHCIRRINDGDKEMEHELFALYQRGLEAGHLFENDGTLSRFTYHNIVAAGLRCQALDWVDQFIHQYNPYLERAYREGALSFNLARLEYARKRYDNVQQLLQKANYHDPLLHLAAKTLLLKTYFTLGEFDLLYAHLDAMRNYIHRKKVLGYHRKNYLNIIRYTELLLQNGHDRREGAALRLRIEHEPVLTEKEWMLAQLAE